MWFWASALLRKSAMRYLIISRFVHLCNKAIFFQQAFFQLALIICERSELNFRQCRRRMPLALGGANEMSGGEVLKGIYRLFVYIGLSTKLHVVSLPNFTRNPTKLHVNCLPNFTWVWLEKG